MPTWNEVDLEIDRLINSEGKAVQEACDTYRANCLKEMDAHTGRPVIAYYSGFLQKPGHPTLAINDFDINGFMAVIHNMRRDAGLDLILHTPGGEIEATRALVEYLYSMFGKDIRVIVPQLAMSCGTMIACAAKEIILGKHSSLGPTDPQVNGVPAMGVIHEIEKALKEIEADPIKQVFWQEVFRKYSPTFISNCERSIAGTKNMVSRWLEENMFENEKNPNAKAKEVFDKLVEYKNTTEHGRHFSVSECLEFGLNVKKLEDDQDLQEKVLTIHHSFVATFARLRSMKCIENSIGASWNVSSG
ncbi:S49 family peptidase [Nereida sp. MMG025]|uniref:SDH family Clp fold serine proteinase n=1 Tax=Nereida sp. MMG025 TaxID=2909981 RepID=UPI001F3C4C66|nr:S49 family peptidase [Nereida sp. MMG025]MCF6444576.1 S49 family peptidase [Nereida sp. MMG025]